MSRLFIAGDTYPGRKVMALLVAIPIAFCVVSVANAKDDAVKNPPKQNSEASTRKTESPRKVEETPSDYPSKETLAASILRGEIVYQNYCMLCHGVNGDGRGRAARMYTPKPANLRESKVPDAYKAMIIRKGGKAMGRSEFMPPWGDELTDEQVVDVVTYLRSIAPADVPK
ncbi:MAG TPA: cytochrome c [Burkholderiales bacterium]|jgi:mono/diheme cytochrome c family protein|nr:cytochrome c [Burkholderiales bacterium]